MSGSVRACGDGAAAGAVREAGSEPAPTPAVKRIFDAVSSALGLLVLSPLLLLIAAAVKLDSNGPVLFSQERVGKGGALFKMYKFRSMTTGCDPAVHREHVTKLILGQTGDEARGADGSFKLDADPRVTRVGRVLRKTSLDELPQLINVLKGEMSLVGPRPPLVYEFECYEPRHARRLSVLPGITGLWQVSGRTRLSFEEMVDLDVRYAQTWSIWLDLWILARTLPAVLSTRGAG